MLPMPTLVGEESHRGGVEQSQSSLHQQPPLGLDFNLSNPTSELTGPPPANTHPCRPLSWASYLDHGCLALAPWALRLRLASRAKDPWIRLIDKLANTHAIDPKSH